MSDHAAQEEMCDGGFPKETDRPEHGGPPRCHEESIGAGGRSSIDPRESKALARVPAGATGGEIRGGGARVDRSEDAIGIRREDERGQGPAPGGLLAEQKVSARL